MVKRLSEFITPYQSLISIILSLKDLETRGNIFNDHKEVLGMIISKEVSAFLVACYMENEDEIAYSFLEEIKQLLENETPKFDISFEYVLSMKEGDEK